MPMPMPMHMPVCTCVHASTQIQKARMFNRQRGTFSVRTPWAATPSDAAVHSLLVPAFRDGVMDELWTNDGAAIINQSRNLNSLATLQCEAMALVVDRNIDPNIIAVIVTY